MSPGEALPGAGLSCAVVGARRERQGTGEFVARALARLGVRIAGVVGRSRESAGAAARALRERHGIETVGFATLEDLLAAERPDAVAICSPPETHRAFVRAALLAGCHTFCEKPLFWEPGLEEAQARESALWCVTEARTRGLAFVLNAQWPFTLGTFFELYPDVATEPLRDVSMHLGPIGLGPSMVVDSAPHLLSLLHTGVGAGKVARIRVEAAGDRLETAFEYEHQRGTTRARLRLDRTPEPPRPAGYALNGRAVERRIELPGYRLSFETPDGRRAQLEDPLDLSVRDFVRAVRENRGPDAIALVDGLSQLHGLVAAVAREENA